MSDAAPHPREELIAESARRRLTRVDVEGEPSRVRKDFIARTPLRRLREALKAVVGRTASQREARALRALEAAGVAVPSCCAESATGFGARRLELSFVGGVPLAAVLGDRRARRVALVRIGQELHRAHAAGWVHGDLHEGNALVDGGDVVLIDWQRAAKQSGGDGAERVRDIARFEHSMWLHGVPRGDRMRFRRAALGGARDVRDAALRGRLRSVGPAVRRRARIFAAVRTRRAMKPVDGRARVALPGLRGLRLSSIGDAEIAEALAAHRRLAGACAADVKEPIGRFVERAGDAVLKRDHRSVVTAVQVGRRSFVVKQVRKAGWRRRVADAVRGSPARRSFRAGHGLLLRGVATAAPFAWVERRRLGLPSDSWLVLEDLRGLWPVAEAPTSEPPNPAREATRPPPEAIVEALVSLLLQLHRADVSQGDLQAHHVLLRPREGEHARFEPVLIDCDATRFDAGLGDAERIADLAALDASIPDRLLSVEERRTVFDQIASGLPFARERIAVFHAVLERSRARGGVGGGAGGGASSGEACGAATTARSAGGQTQS